MANLKRGSLAFLPLFLFLFSALYPLQSFSAQQASPKYVVLNVTNHEGKTFHKALSEKDQDAFKKSIEEDYQKAKKAYQDEEKAFQKENPGKKFDKSKPQNPRFKVVKRDLKTYNEALKIAFDLDKEKNGKKKGENGKKNGKKEEKGAEQGGTGKKSTAKEDEQL